LKNKFSDSKIAVGGFLVIIILLQTACGNEIFAGGFPDIIEAEHCLGGPVVAVLESLTEGGQVGNGRVHEVNEKVW